MAAGLPETLRAEVVSAAEGPVGAERDPHVPPDLGPVPASYEAQFQPAARLVVCCMRPTTELLACLHAVQVLGSEGGSALRAHGHVVRQPHLFDLRDGDVHALFFLAARTREEFVEELQPCSVRSDGGTYLPAVVRAQHLQRLPAEAPDVLRAVVEPLLCRKCQRSVDGCISFTTSSEFQTPDRPLRIWRA